MRDRVRETEQREMVEICLEFSTCALNLCMNSRLRPNVFQLVMGVTFSPLTQTFTSAIVLWNPLFSGIWWEIYLKCTNVYIYIFMSVFTSLNCTKFLKMVIKLNVALIGGAHLFYFETETMREISFTADACYCYTMICSQSNVQSYLSVFLL